jgi:hypothetical protein
MSGIFHFLLVGCRSRLLHPYGGDFLKSNTPYPRRALVKFRELMRPRWTQERMAAYLGVDLGAYKNHEIQNTGHRDVFVQYARRLHVSLDWLYGLTDRMWGPTVYRAQADFLIKAAKLPAEYGYSARVAFALQMLRDSAISFEAAWLAGLLYTTESDLQPLLDTPISGVDDHCDPPPMHVAEGLSGLFEIPLDWFLAGSDCLLDSYSSWRPIIESLTRSQCTPQEVEVVLPLLINSVQASRRLTR